MVPKSLWIKLTIVKLGMRSGKKRKEKTEKENCIVLLVFHLTQSNMFNQEREGKIHYSLHFNVYLENFGNNIWETTNKPRMKKY